LHRAVLRAEPTLGQNGLRNIERTPDEASLELPWLRHDHRSLDELLPGLEDEMSIATQRSEIIQLKKSLAELTQRLKENQERFELSTCGARVGIWEYEYASNSFIFSKSYEEQLGYSEGELTGSHAEWADRLHPADRELTIARFEGAAASAEPTVELEHRIRNIAGEYRWFLCQGQVIRDVNGIAVRALGARLDITKRKEAEEKLRIYLDAAPDAIVICNAAGQIKMVNEQFEADFGFTRQEIEGKPLSLLIPDASADRHENLVRSYVNNPQTRGFKGTGMALPARNKNGQTFPAEIRLSPQMTADGLVVIASVRNVSMQKKISKELMAAKIAAGAAELAKSTFLAHMSHEIRTPLGIILGHAEMFQADPEMRIEHRLSADAINRNGKMLLASVDDILAHAQVDSTGMEFDITTINTVSFIDGNFESLRLLAAKKNLRFEVTVGTNLPKKFHSNVKKLQQVVANVVGNAIKFTEQGCISIHISTRTDCNSKNLLVISVKDSGSGIPLASQNQIFEPFTQGETFLNRRFWGSGLGLSLSRDFAKSLGGNVVLKESNIGVGSIFEITIATIDSSLPRTFFRSNSRMGKLRMTRDLKFSILGTQPVVSRIDGLRILVAEDFPDSRELIYMMLTRAGAKVEVADNGAEAVEMAVRKHFDIILMDIQMPIMTGWEAATALRLKGYQQPILALTAHARSAELETCVTSGCDGYLLKPFQMANLIQTIAAQVSKNVRPHPNTRENQMPSRTEHPGDQDSSATQPLLSTLDSSDQMYKKLVPKFVGTLQEKLDDLRRAFEEANWTGISSVAHQLKGAGGGYGFPVITEFAGNIEGLALGAPVDSEKVKSAIDELAKVCKQAQAGLKEW
jgi:PAS domain S-box-containing protein